MEWRRGQVIGRGSSATVHTATSFSHVCAVKSVEFSQALFLQREQKILSNLMSPYIVGYIGHDITKENDKFVYNLFMELVPGGTLSDMVKKSGGWLDESTIKYFTCQILFGLEYLHSRNIAHCDIKGENILIGESGAKIADFGCARLQGLGDDVAMPVGGTPMFMAPEVAWGAQQGFPADIWALGCTLIEMATGETPWPNMTDSLAVMYKIAYSQESPVVPEFLSMEARDFLEKCFRRDATERWTVKQLLDHPFLMDSGSFSRKEFQSSVYFSGKKIPGSDILTDFNSPTSILDQGLWSSIPESRTPCGVIKNDGGDAPLKRIERLISSCHTWTREENWITVR